MEEYTLQLEETWLDYPDPESNAVIVYFCGCNHFCKGCHSKLLQKSCIYTETPEEMLFKIKNYAERADTNKLVFLGGDPLYEINNLQLTKFFVTNLKNLFDICIFTGYNIEHVKNLNIDGVKYWKCGKFDLDHVRQSMKTDDEYILASPNQDFYDTNYNKISENGILKFNK